MKISLYTFNCNYEGTYLDCSPKHPILCPFCNKISIHFIKTINVTPKELYNLIKLNKYIIKL